MQFFFKGNDLAGLYILTEANRCQNKHHRANNDQTLPSGIYRHWFSKMNPIP